MKKLIPLVLLISFCWENYAQNKAFYINNIPKEGILLNQHWQFRAGDSGAMIDDSAWVSIDPTQDIMDLEQFGQEKAGWFRLRLPIDTSLAGKTFALSVKQTGASQVFLNGKQIGQFGTFSSISTPSEGYDPAGEVVNLTFSEKPIQTIVVRFEKPSLHLIKHIFYNNPCLSLKILPTESVIKNYHNTIHITLFEHYLDIFKAGIFFVLACFYFWLFYYDKSQKGYLIISIWTLLMVIIFSISTYTFYPINISTRNVLSIIVSLLIPVELFFHYWAITCIFDIKRSIRFWLITGLLLLTFPILFIFYGWGWMYGSFLMSVVVSLEIAYIALKVAKRGDKTAMFVAISQIVYFTFFISSILVVNKTIPLNISPYIVDLIVNIGVIAPPFAYIYYFATRFELYRKSMLQKVDEIQQLSQEKQETLLKQNAELQAALLQGQTLERKRVAADLHDNLGSTMSSLVFTMDSIDAKKLNTEEQEVYLNLKKMLSSAYDDVRLLSHNLLPEEFEKQGLIPALQYFLRKINKNNKTQFELRVADDFGRLDKKVEFELYSICLELATNIIKHAKATKAYIELACVGEEVNLLVSDNGVGTFSNDSDGRGMKNIQARVESLNGNWLMYTKNGLINEITVPIMG